MAEKIMVEKQEAWTIRYRTGVAGVRVGTILATASKAEDVAKWWCAKEPTRKFVGLERAILATEEDMLDAQTAPSSGKGT
jgi:hypothetical protein